MKHFNPLTTALLSLTVLASAAAGQGRGVGFPGQGERGGPPVNPISKALDTDGDGELSAAEIEAAATALKTLDRDKNGTLSSDELRPQRGNSNRGEGRGRTGGPGRAGGPDFLARVKSFDTNKDGKLQKSEVPERMQRMIEHGDTDGDDALDEVEIKALAKNFGGGRGQGRGGDQGRGRGDRDRDAGRGPGGPPNSADLVSQAMTFDADEDGKLSKEELKQAVEGFVAQMGRGDQGSRGGQGRGRQGGRERQRPAAE